LARSEVAGPADLVDAYQDRGTGDGPGRGPQPGMISARRCSHGLGDGHDDAGHQQVPGPAHKRRRISFDADVAVGEQRGVPAPGTPAGS